MKTVLYITNLPAPYRIDFFNLLAQKVELTVLYERKSASNRDDKWVSQTQKRPFREIYLDGRSFGAENTLSLGIVRHLRQNTYDEIVLSNYNSPAVMLAIFYLKRKKRPFWLNCDGMLPKSGQGYGLKEKLKRYLIASASFWISTGKTTTRELCRYGARPERVYEVPFSSVSELEIDREPIDHAEIRKRLSLPSGRLLLYVGRFIKVKGIDVLLSAYARLREEMGEDVPKLLLLGGTEEQLDSLCGPGPRPGVLCRGFQKPEAVVDYYRAANLLVLPTLGDSWGLVVNEAMARGLPVVTTDRCGAGLELIEPGKNGFLVPAGSVDALAEAIQNGLMLPDAAAAAKNTASRYTIEAMTNATARLLR